MSDLRMYEFEDIEWDEFCRSGDHMVPISDFERTDDHSTLTDRHKKPRHEITTSGNRTATEFFDQDRKRKEFSIASKRRNTMLEKDSWSHESSDVFPSSSNSNLIEEAASANHVFTDNKVSERCANDTLLGEKTRYPSGNISHTASDFDFFENTEEKGSSDFFSYAWPEIGNFEDVDSLFRSCDETFGLGASKEDELGWFASPNTYPETNPMGKEVENDDSSKNYSNDSTTAAATSIYNNGWTLEKFEPTVTDKQEAFIANEQSNEHRRQFKQHDQSSRKRKDHLYLKNICLSRMDHQPNEAAQVPSDLHSGNSHLSALTSINPNISSVKSETNDHGNRTSVKSAVADGLDANGRQAYCYGDKVDHGDTEGVSVVIPGELVSSNARESVTMNSGVDDISLEAASFGQLQLVMEQLDMRTKLCIRDSLYRLARSAEQRHNKTNLHGDEKDSFGAFVDNGTNNLMNIETDTNPIDRSIAHLLFHRPSESSSLPANNSLPSQAPIMIRGSVPPTPIVAEKLVECQESASGLEKVSES